MQLIAGQNTALPDVVGVRISLRWPRHPDIDADLSALLLNDGKVISSDHFVFYNQAASPDGSVTHVGKVTDKDAGTVTDSVDLGLASVPAAVDAVVLAVSAHPGDTGALAQLGQPEVVVVDPTGQVLASHRLSDLTTEAAVNVLEVYRRAGAWKVRAVGQGWSDGLAGLARDFGVEVDDEDTYQQDALTDDQPARTPGRPAVDWSDPPVPAGYEL